MSKDPLLKLTFPPATETVYCEPFLRKCSTQGEFKDLGIDVKGLASFPNQIECEKQCRLPNDLDQVLLATIGDRKLYDVLPHASIHKTSNAYKEAKAVEDVVEKLERYIIENKETILGTPNFEIPPEIVKEIVKTNYVCCLIKDKCNLGCMASCLCVMVVFINLSWRRGVWNIKNANLQNGRYNH